jgi:hypothetical protein
MTDVRVDNRLAMRLVAAVGLSLALLAACGRATPPDYPRYGGYGTVTAAGLEVHDGACLYDRSSMVASGVIRQTAAVAGGTKVSVTLTVPVDNGSVRFDRTVQYPGPASTGTDVPFRLEVNTEGQPGMDCEIQVGWAG